MKIAVSFLESVNWELIALHYRWDEVIDINRLEVLVDTPGSDESDIL